MFMQSDELTALDLYEEMADEAAEALALFNEVYEALAKEHSNEENLPRYSPRWADLYTTYAPRLREVKNNAINQGIAQEAQELINELFLEQSLPMGELETRSTLWEEEPEYDEAWETDFLEVQKSIELYESGAEDAEEAVIMMGEHFEVEPRKHRTHTDGDAFTTRIVEAYRELETQKAKAGLGKAFVPKQEDIALAISIMEFIPLEEEEVLYEEGEITATSIVQNETQEYKPNWEDMAELREIFSEYIRRIKWTAKNIRKEYDMLEAEDLLATMSAKLTEAWGDSLVLCANLLVMKYQYRVQDIYLAMAPLLVEGFLADDILEGVKVPGGSMAEWVDTFGEDVLAETWEMGALNIPQNALEVLDAKYEAERPIENILNIPAQYAKMCAKDGILPQVTAPYVEAYIEAMCFGANFKQAHHAGMTAWVMKSEQPPAKAYRKTIKKGFKAAWAAAFNTGWIIGGDKDGLKVETMLGKGKDGPKTTVVPWQYVAYKIRNGELFVKPDFEKKSELATALQKHNIPRNLWAMLKP